MKQPPLPIFRSGSGDAFCGRGKRGRPCRREGACGSRLVIERRKRQRACGQGAGLCQEASGRRCCIRTSFSPRRAEGHIERDVRCSPPPGAAAGCRAVARNGSRAETCEKAPSYESQRSPTAAGRAVSGLPANLPSAAWGGAAAGCRAVARNGSRTKLRKSAIVRIATFADGGRTSGERLACEPAVRRMGRRRTAHAARDLFSALRQSAAAGCRPLTRSRLSPEKQHAPNASPPQKTESPERLDKALGRFRIYHTAAARDDRVSACGPPWPRCTPWRAAPSSGAPSGSVFPSSCRCRTSCCRCARGPSRGCG